MSAAVYPNDLSISTTTADATYRNRTKRRCPQICCLCSSLTLLVLALLVLLLIIPILFFSNIFNDTVEDLNVLEIGSLTASNFNLSSRPNQISADWNIDMKFTTKGKGGYFKFTDTKVSVYYNDKMIGLKKIKSFHVSSKHPPMQFGGEFSGSSGYVDDSMIKNVGQEIMAGSVKFNVVFEAWVGKSFIKGWFVEDFVPHVGYCEDVELFFGSPNVAKARMLNGSHKCQLYRKDPTYVNTDRDDSFSYYAPLCFGTQGGGLICV